MKAAEKILSTAANTVGRRLGDLSVEALGLGATSSSHTGFMAGLDTSGETGPPTAPATVQRPTTLTQIDPWGLVMKWGGPALVVLVGVVVFKAAWSWAGTAGRCTK